MEIAPFSAERSGTLSGNKLLEVSGMAASRRRADLLWLHNDSGSRAILHAVSVTGQPLGTVTLRGATSRDWEDMASFDYLGKPMLVVADVGDNNATRATLWLHFIEEPVVPDDGLPEDLTVEIAWSVPFRYPGGAADCEAVAVDTTLDQVLLLTKRENPPTLYALPIKPEGARPASGKLHEATRLGQLSTIPRPLATDLLADPMFGPWSSQPTALDIAGNELVILTYRDAYRFVRDADQTWQQVFTQAPTIVPLPKLKQSEALAFDRDGQDFFVTSERRNAPIYRLRRTAVNNKPPAQESPDD